jgi:hypothetical protein
MNEEQEQQTEVKETTPFFNFLDKTDFISNIVEVGIIFLASFIAVLKSKEQIKTYIGILFKKRHDNEIDDILNKIQALSSADRVLLGLFDARNINYEYEVCNRGIGKIRNKLRAFISEEELKVFRESEEQYIITYLDDNQTIINDSIIEIDKAYKKDLIRVGVQCSCRLLMRQGIISIQYNKENNLEDFYKNKEEILMLRDYLEVVLNGK